jgi:dTMP kinase
MFITLEGVEGSGKTTQINYIVEFLEKNGHRCIVTREPGDTTIGRQIRSLLLNPDNKNMEPLTELFLYAADRAQHLHERVLPALKEGKTVICDRFKDATTAYQGAARGIDMTFIEKIHDLVLNGLIPDITLLLDINPENGLKRAWSQIDSGKRSASETRFENEALAFHNKVRNGYLEIAAKEPDRFRIIDASLTIKEVQTQIQKHLQPFIK